VTPSGLLLVEDDDGDAFLVQDLLEQAASSLTVHRAVTLRDALHHLRSVGAAVVLVDLGLPDSEGLGIVRDVVAAAPGAAVLVLTGLDDEYRGIAALAAGAQDYLVKGQVNAPLLSRSIRYALERKRVDESLRLLVASELRAEENARLERGLLPQPTVHDPRLRVVTRSRPGRHQAVVGGDFFDVVERPDGRLHVVVGDVSGHGPDEAALGVLLRVAWRTMVLAGLPPAAVIPLLGEVLDSERQTDEVFATAVYLVVEADRRTGQVVCAGHPAPISLSGGPAAWNLTPGPPVGIDDGEPRLLTHVDLTGRWPLLLFTDGLVEGRHHDGRLGEDGLLVVVADELDRDAEVETLPDRLIDRAEKLNGGPLADDVAVLLLDAGGAP
jgi:serine phosphatase RsbU (regulator of sigma subunit)